MGGIAVGRTARLTEWPRAAVASCCPFRWPALRLRCRAGSIWRRPVRRCAARHARDAGRRLGRGPGRGGAAKKMSVIASAARAADAEPMTPLHRLGRGLHAGAARRGAAHGDERRPARWSRRAPRPSIAPTGARHPADRRPPARACSTRWPTGRHAGRTNWPCCRLSATRVVEASPMPGLLKPPSVCRAACLRPARRRHDPARSRRRRRRRPRWSSRSGAQAFRHPARRRHRRGQDRGLFRGDRRGARRRASGAGAAARDRARGAMARPFRAALRRRRRRCGTPTSPPASAGRPGGRSPRARPGWWSAPARRCSCPSRARPDRRRRGARRRPSSRRTASSTTPATWRWCAPRSRRSRSCWSRRRRRWRRVANVERRPLRRLHLPDRHGGRQPAGDHGDRSAARQPPDAAASCRRRLIAAMRRHAGPGEQALLFLNRRGYAPLTLCRACGHRMQCPNCTAWLVEHRFTAPAAMPPLRP